ncbi:MAG TPA: hypothetical protein VMV46_05165 [Thermoanaerobaculia bacterium]|nr:hypothetical protein [Thermoanaerobaculia bacterium]
MPFPYYRNLSKRQQATYRRSDAVARVDLPAAGSLAPAVETIRTALAAEDRRGLEPAVRGLVAEIHCRLGVPAVDVVVRAVRPSADWGELHGLYTSDPKAPRARIEVWMRTAKHKRPVAFRTFLRTVLHEVCHHLDFELLRLPDSFHTEGFFQRESSLFRQLMGEDRQ